MAGHVGINWDEQPLGQVPDPELARKLGVSVSTVRSARRRRGILPVDPGYVDWDSEPLGRVPDGELARRLGVHASRVHRARQRRGIPPVGHGIPPVGHGIPPVGHVGINWDEQPLGRVPDSELARRLGVSAPAVHMARRKRGISPIDLGYMDWDSEPLGQVPDSELARRLGVSVSTVQWARQKRGISPVDPGYRDWDRDNEPLGQVPDSELARRLGVSVSTVRKARRRRGIPTYQTTCPVCGCKKLDSRGITCTKCSDYMYRARIKYPESDKLALIEAKAAMVANLTAEKIRERQEENEKRK